MLRFLDSVSVLYDFCLENGTIPITVFGINEDGNEYEYEYEYGNSYGYGYGSGNGNGYGFGYGYGYGYGVGFSRRK